MPPISAERAHVRGVIAGLSRDRAPDDPDLVAARQRCRELKLANYISALVDQAPPLNIEQRGRLAQLLLSGGGGSDG